MLATTIMETLRRLVDLRAFLCDAPVSKDLGADISAFRDASNLRFTEDVKTLKERVQMWYENNCKAVLELMLSFDFPNIFWVISICFIWSLEEKQKIYEIWKQNEKKEYFESFYYVISNVKRAEKMFTSSKNDYFCCFSYYCCKITFALWPFAGLDTIGQPMTASATCKLALGCKVRYNKI